MIAIGLQYSLREFVSAQPSQTLEVYKSCAEMRKNMRKLPLYAMTAATAMMMTGTMTMTSQAAVKTYVIPGNSKTFGFSGNCNINDLKEKLEGLGINCDQIQFPDLPVTPDSPQLPDIGVQPPQDAVSDQSFVQQVVNLVNEERAKAGLSPLTVSSHVTAAASVRSREIEQSFSHTRPDGSSFSTALTQNGVSFKGSGENIAYGQKTPQEVMNSWMNSAGHRANILNKNYTTIGVGYYQNSAGVGYWTQLFTY